ncbi:MAG: hypothetical protein ACFCVH_15470 [Alphaproteobacteria bacterium]
MTAAATSANALDPRDQAFAELVTLEVQRSALQAAARDGDPAAGRALAALRRQLARQAVLAADLDAMADLGDAAGAQAGPAVAGREERLAALCAERLALARRIEAHVEAVVAACLAIAENAEEFARAGLNPTPIQAELGRFGDRFCFYLDSMLDFVTGARGLAGHPAYRKLSEVLLDGEAFLKLYRRAAGPCEGRPPGR